MKPIKFTFAGLFLLISITLNAQNLKLSYNNQDVSNSEVTIEAESDDEVKVVLNITNTSSSDIQIKIKKRVIEDIAGSVNTFCLGECFSPSVEESPNPFTIGAGQTTTSSDFYVEFYPEGNTGTAKISYEVRNINNDDDKVTVTVNFNISSTTSINTTLTNEMLKAFPNPVTENKLKVFYNLPQITSITNLSIRNILGTKVLERKVDSPNGTLEFNTVLLPNGVYIYSIEDDGKVLISKKLIINR